MGGGFSASFWNKQDKVVISNVKAFKLNRELSSAIYQPQTHQIAVQKTLGQNKWASSCLSLNVFLVMTQVIKTNRCLKESGICTLTGLLRHCTSSNNLPHDNYIQGQTTTFGYGSELSHSNGTLFCHLKVQKPTAKFRSISNLLP